MSLRRLARVALVSGVAVFLAVGALASYRAYQPVYSVTIRIGVVALEPGADIRVETVTSGRGPVTIRVEIVQGSHAETVAIDHVASRQWAFWDFRLVRRATHARASRALLSRFEAGPVVVRATVQGARAWLRQPPAVVEDVPALVPAGGR
ncbi:MAG TPA: hypothetical protein VMT70_11415 [Vicinamibacteria bacterium]|nr:hypothetical protein [Vicinamibacteria bacterium]